VAAPIEEHQMKSDKPAVPGESVSSSAEIHPSEIWGGSVDDHRSSLRERLLPLIADELAAAGHHNLELAKRIAEKVGQLYEDIVVRSAAS
jgi:hypothetical protein